MNNKITSPRRELFKNLPSIDELCQILDIDNISYPQNIIKNTLRRTLSSIRGDIKSGKIDKNIKTIAIDRAKENVNQLISFNLN